LTAARLRPPFPIIASTLPAQSGRRWPASLQKEAGPGDCSAGPGRPAPPCRQM